MIEALIRLLMLPPLALPIPTGPCCDGEKPRAAVRVTVVAILASMTSDVIDPRLEVLAREVKKRNPNLKGFTHASTQTRSIPIGESAQFKLIEQAIMIVRVQRQRDEENRIGLSIKPPELGEISYACTCNKFFPVVTPYKTDQGDHLIVAVMAKPCPGKDD